MCTYTCIYLEEGEVYVDEFGNQQPVLRAQYDLIQAAHSIIPGTNIYVDVSIDVWTSKQNKFSLKCRHVNVVQRLLHSTVKGYLQVPGKSILYICDRLQEKGPCAAKNNFSVNAGFRKYDAIAISIENLTLIGRVVCEI